ncbi:MAG: CynX/NimT family MFS transporter [Burkholderiaceae bacterium]
MTAKPHSPGSLPAWIILIIGMVAAFGAGKLPPALLMIADQHQMSLFQASFLISLFQLAGAVGGVFAGTLADRYGHRNIMQLGLTMTLLGIVAGVLAGSANALLVSRSIESFGFILAALPGPALLRQVISSERLKIWLGAWGTYMPVGFAVALLTAPLIMQFPGRGLEEGAWRMIWVVHGVLVLACWVALVMWVPAGRSQNAESLSAPASAFAPLLVRTLSSSGPWLLAASFGVYAGQYLSIVSFLPTIYQQAGLTLTVAGSMTALVAGINLVGNLAAGRLIQGGLNPGAALIIATLSLLIGSWLVFASPLPFTARYMVVVLMSACCGLIPGSLFVLVPRYAPSSQTVSSTVGLMQQGSAIGQVVLPPLVAWSASLHGGWSNAWYALGAMAACGLVLAIMIYRRERIQPVSVSVA